MPKSFSAKKSDSQCVTAPLRRKFSVSSFPNCRKMVRLFAISPTRAARLCHNETSLLDEGLANNNKQHFLFLYYITPLLLLPTDRHTHTYEPATLSKTKSLGGCRGLIVRPRRHHRLARRCSPSLVVVRPSQSRRKTSATATATTTTQTMESGQC